ncbi:hypothetical protein [Helicobacter salomonis]|uniref:hypothetical protein n=1 Tax=Helicobacter salomonis TaxID=56878 RepID=UPI000CF1130E|nr:hypothetical protein [Helicobacter salomonis]
MKPKEHTGSFFLTHAVLGLLDVIAQLEGQSRGVVVERIMRFYLLKRGESNAKDYWDKSKRAYKAKKKVLRASAYQSRLQARGQSRGNQSERAARALHPRSPRGLRPRKSLSAHAQRNLFSKS